MDLNEQNQANNLAKRRFPESEALSGSKGNVRNEHRMERNNRSGLQERPNRKAVMRENIKQRRVNPAHAEDKLHGKYVTRKISKQVKNNLNEAMERMKTGKHLRKKSKKEAWQLEQEKGAKTYKLSAYTTTDSINKKFRSENRQRVLRKILVTLLIIVIILIVIGKYLDFSKLQDLDLKNLRQIELE